MTRANDLPTTRRAVHNLCRVLLCGEEPKQQQTVENNSIVFYVEPLYPRVLYRVSSFSGRVLGIAFRRVLRDLFISVTAVASIARRLTIPETG